MKASKTEDVVRKRLPLKKTSLQTIMKAIGAAGIIAFFSCFFYWGFWSPAESLKNVPIAFINDDKGVMVDGRYVNLGDTISDDILGNDSASWRIVDDSVLDDGIQKSGYLMAFRIPDDFTECVTSGKDSTPQAADLVVYRNIRYNYLFSQFTSQMVKTFEESIDKQIASSYVEESYSGLRSADDGLTDAAAGAASLADGASKLDDGISCAAEGSQDLSAGIGSLASASSASIDGASEIASAGQKASAGASALASSTSALASGASVLAQNTEVLKGGTAAIAARTQALSEGLKAASSNLTDALSKASALQATSSNMTAGLDSLSVSLADVDLSIGSSDTPSTALGATYDAETCLENAKRALGSGGSYQGRTADDWIDAASSSLTSVDASLKDMKEGLATATAEVGASSKAGKTLAYTSSQIDDGLGAFSHNLAASQDTIAQLSFGTTALAASFDALSKGMQQTDAGTQSLAAGVSKIDVGASSLDKGNALLASGTSSLLAGLQTASGGSKRLYDGASSLATGLQTAQEGSNELRDGSQELSISLADGSDRLSRGLSASPDQMASYISAPTDLTEEDYGAFDSYGQGIAPFFMTTALWLGALVIFFLVEPFYPKRINAGRWRTVLGRLPRYMGICLLESIGVATCAMAFGVTKACGVDLLAFFLYAFGVSFSFMLIMQFLNMAGGLVGKAVAILVLVFQLVAAGGTMPVELGNPFLATIKPWLPFTYAIDGFREAISTGVGSVMVWNIIILLGMSSCCLALSLICWGFAAKRQEQEDRAYAECHYASK